MYLVKFNKKLLEFAFSVFRLCSLKHDRLQCFLDSKKYLSIGMNDR